MTLPDSPAITQFVSRLKAQKPATQANPHQSKLAGNLTIEYCVVNTVNNTPGPVGALPAFTCSITIKGSTQNAPWIGNPPTPGRNIALVQPPLTYVLGFPQRSVSGQYFTPSYWIPIGSVFAPAFGSGWGNYGGSSAPCAFRLTGDMVQIRGVVVGGGSGVTIFTLPSGYRPLNQEGFMCTGNGAVAWVNVLSTGAVQLGGGSGTTYLNLGTIQFSVT